jgi:hypothetical protein
VDSVGHQNRHAQITANTNSPELKQPNLQNAMEAAQTILYCVEHQKRIVDDVLTLSKLDADLLEIM